MWCGGKRSRICGDCDHVLNRQPGYYGLHRLRSGCGPRTRLEGEELANEIRGITAGERRNEAYAAQPCAMTSDARDDEPVSAGSRDGAATLDAPGRHIGDVGHAVVAQLVTFEIGRTLDDAGADRLGSCPRDASIHESGLTGAWNACGLDHSSPRRKSQARKVARGHGDFCFGRVRCNGVHAVAGDPTGRRISSGGTAEGGQLRNDVVLGQTGKSRVLGPSHSIRQMTIGTRKEIRPPAARDDIRHRRVSARMPIRRRESIDDLWQREPRHAVGDAMQSRAIGDRGIGRAAGKSPERYIGGLLRGGKSDREDNDDYREHRCSNFRVATIDQGVDGESAGSGKNKRQARRKEQEFELKPSKPFLQLH